MTEALSLRFNAKIRRLRPPIESNRLHKHMPMGNLELPIELQFSLPSRLAHGKVRIYFQTLENLSCGQLCNIVKVLCLEKRFFISYSKTIN